MSAAGSSGASDASDEYDSHVLIQVVNDRRAAAASDAEKMLSESEGFSEDLYNVKPTSCGVAAEAAALALSIQARRKSLRHRLLRQQLRLLLLLQLTPVVAKKKKKMLLSRAAKAAAKAAAANAGKRR